MASFSQTIADANINANAEATMYTATTTNAATSTTDSPIRNTLTWETLPYVTDNTDYNMTRMYQSIWTVLLKNISLLDPNDEVAVAMRTNELVHLITWTQRHGPAPEQTSTTRKSKS
jgi:hypothetical protein